MRKVIGIGETILDIIFRNDQPSAAVPGGSVFNGIVSLGRMGVNVCFISETGNDHVGNIILQFMRDNHIPTDHVNVFPDGKSPVSLLSSTNTAMQNISSIKTTRNSGWTFYSRPSMKTTSLSSVHIMLSIRYCVIRYWNCWT